ncbi:MAG: hypothetical protein FWD97_05520 [Defluviitaleaceae bacterium]|nr:hypothetical protein [Defluviitaleaceae bacterium]
MSLPSFNTLGKIPNREEALSAVIASIAMEEVALAKIMEAESEKLRYAIKKMKSSCDTDMCMLLRINESVENVVGHIVDMQILLKNKLQLALGHLPKPPQPPPCPPPHPPKPPCPPKPPKPPCPPKPPKHNCSAVFHACNNYRWSSGKTLFLVEDPCHKHSNICCIKAERRCGDTFIVLPPYEQFKVEIDFILLNPCKKPVVVELVHEQGRSVVLSKKYSFDEKKRRIEIRDVLDLRGDLRSESRLSFRLISDTDLEFEIAVVGLTSIYKTFVY